MRSLSMVAAIALIACTDAPADDLPLDDTKSDGLDWETRVVTKDTGTVIIEAVAYRSQGLLVVGQVCRPKAPGKHEVYIYAHGGFLGITDGLGMEWNGGACEQLAAEGWVVLAPAYRGEDGSEGNIEICLGEVDDLLEMTRIALAQPYSDRDRVAIVGASHGGCITLRALQRGLPAQVAVDMFGPTDWTAVLRLWEAQADPSVQLLLGTIGTPEANPLGYAARSPITFDELQAWPGSLLVVHGVDDEVVPATGSCIFAATEGTFTNHHVDAFGRVLPVAPRGCAGLGAWRAGPLPTTWPSTRHLVMFDNAGHGATVPIGPALLGTAASYLATKLP